MLKEVLVYGGQIYGLRVTLRLHQGFTVSVFKVMLNEALWMQFFINVIHRMELFTSLRYKTLAVSQEPEEVRKFEHGSLVVDLV